MGAKKRALRSASLRDLARQRVPLLIERFLKHAVLIIGHPRRVPELHRMRLRGKALRYMMEFTAFAFERQFADCLEEVKRLLVLMGRIHDCDVFIPFAAMAIEDVSHYNRILPQRSGQIPLGSLRAYVQHEKKLRRSLFNEVCGILKRWEYENFPDTVRRAMFFPGFS